MPYTKFGGFSAVVQRVRLTPIEIQFPDLDAAFGLACFHMPVWAHDRRPLNVKVTNGAKGPGVKVLDGNPSVLRHPKRQKVICLD